MFSPTSCLFAAAPLMTNDMLMRAVLGNELLKAEYRFAIEAHLPDEETKAMVEMHFGRNRKWRFDYADVENLIAWEIEGGVWVQGRHTRGKGFIADMEKYNCAAMLGWRVVRSTTDGPSKVKALEVVKALRERPRS